LERRPPFLLFFPPETLPRTPISQVRTFPLSLLFPPTLAAFHFPFPLFSPLFFDAPKLFRPPSPSRAVPPSGLTCFRPGLYPDPPFLLRRIHLSNIVPFFLAHLKHDKFESLPFLPGSFLFFSLFSAHGDLMVPLLFAPYTPPLFGVKILFDAAIYLFLLRLLFISLPPPLPLPFTHKNFRE